MDASSQSVNCGPVGSHSRADRLRLLCGTLLLCAVASGVAPSAQSPPPMPEVPRLPRIGLPLPHIGLPPPAPVPETSQARERETARGTRHPQAGRRRGGGTSAGAVVLVLPTFSTGQPASAAVVERGVVAPIPAPTSGTLSLEVEPQVAVQFFVDGAYVGTSDELGFGLDLEAGDRQIELRAEGFEPLPVIVRVAAGRSIRYPAVLRASSEPAPRPASVAPAAMVLYVIPGCYAGNVPPEDVTLPAGCDRSRTTTLRR